MLKISKKSLLVQLIIALVAVVGIFVVIYFTKPKQVEAPVVTTVDTSNWKIYKNEKYGFEFMYPNNWIIEDSGSTINLQSYERNQKIKLSSDISIPSYELSINIDSIDSFIPDESSKKTIFGGFTAFVDKPIDGDGVVTELINVKNDPYILVIDAFLPRSGVVEKILSTFKFTTPTAKPAPITSAQPIACTMDAKMCPDGSYVGRSGPKCEFVCPVSIENEKWISIGQSKLIYGSGYKATPIEVVEDSRCPKGVDCIWAGTVKLKVKLESGPNRVEETVLTLGERRQIFGLYFILSKVIPDKKTGMIINPSDYRFSFETAPSI